MVGVAGRSKACNTCRQRRIKCSYERPHCAQCIKSNFRCTGYQRERLFVIGNTFVPGQPAPDQQRSSKHMVRNTPPRVTWQAAPSPHAFYRQKLLNEYIKSYLPLAHLGPAEDRPWLLLVAELPSPTPALEVAVMALSTAKLGQLNSDPAMIRESLRLYTAGLSEVQKALWNPDLMYRDETLAASMALAMYELFECPEKSRHGYASHHKGCARLVQLRGVYAHTSGLGHQVFRTFRSQGILEALQPHHSTYLSREPWINGPWKDKQKGPMDALFDHLARAPEIFNQVNGITKREPDEALPTALSIIKQCWEIDNNMRAFYEDLERSIPGPLYWPEFSKPRGTSDEGSIFPISFHFPDLNIANVLMIYWAISTILWNGMSQLYELVGRLSSAETTPDGEMDDTRQSNVDRLPPLDYRQDYYSQARNVCQSVEYCMQDQMLGYGTSMAVTPLTMLTGILQDDPKFGPEMRWISEVLKKIDERGIRILRHI